MQNYNSINDGDLNPEVQLELEKLNTASAQINELENKLQELRNDYYDTLSKCSLQLSELSNRIGSAIERARPYVELKRRQIEIQKESQIAAARFETACVQMSHADAVVSKSEALANESSKLDDSTMEILNIAISKVNLSKKRKNEAHKEHQHYLNMYIDMDDRIHLLERKHKNDIQKSKVYFNYSKYMDEKLKDAKLNIEEFELRVRKCKCIYNDALQRLENISNDIHLNRKKDSLGPRGEGVGAEVFSTKSNESSSYSGKSEISESYVNTDLLSSISLTPTPPFENTGIHNIKRISTLGSTTPIVDGLLKAVSTNHSIYLSQSDDRSNYTLPNHYFSHKQPPHGVSNNSQAPPADFINPRGDCLN